MLEISGAVAVITGGGSGIGESIAKEWVKHNDKVILADIVPESISRIEKDILKIGGEVGSIVCDVTKEGDNHALAQLAVEKFGAINLVVPCASLVRDGLMLSIDKHKGRVTKKMSLAQSQSVLDTNLTGVFLTVRECVEQMINLDCKGLICLVSSISSLGIAGQINYSSTKAAVSVMPKVITAEFFRRGLAHRIRCVAVAPGLVATPMVESMDRKVIDNILQNVPIRRSVDSVEVASLVIELYRNEATAGDVFYIHGGLRFGSKG